MEAMPGIHMMTISGMSGRDISAPVCAGPKVTRHSYKGKKGKGKMY
jgi:hypothetical protein